MDNFIVSARKYRPTTFASVVGQGHITSTLKNAISRHQLAHAYLFCGPRGVGKTTCARIFAKAINCLNPGPDAEACNECESCKAFNEGRSFNIHELDAASNNSVDDIRSLTEQVRIPPQIGRYNVFIIDEVSRCRHSMPSSRHSKSRPHTPSSSWPLRRNTKSFRRSFRGVRSTISTAFGLKTP